MVFPQGKWLICLFWQYTHFSGHPEKNMAPEPAPVDNGGSSPRWITIEATRISAPALQGPIVIVLSMLHCLGQRLHMVLSASEHIRQLEECCLDGEGKAFSLLNDRLLCLSGIF